MQYKEHISVLFWRGAKHAIDGFQFWMLYSATTKGRCVFSYTVSSNLVAKGNEVMHNITP